MPGRATGGDGMDLPSEDSHDIPSGPALVLTAGTSVSDHLTLRNQWWRVPGGAPALAPRQEVMMRVGAQIKRRELETLLLRRRQQEDGNERPAKRQRRTPSPPPVPAGVPAKALADMDDAAALALIPDFRTTTVPHSLTSMLPARGSDADVRCSFPSVHAAQVAALLADLIPRNADAITAAASSSAVAAAVAAAAAGLVRARARHNIQTALLSWPQRPPQFSRPHEARLRAARKKVRRLEEAVRAKRSRCKSGSERVLKDFAGESRKALRVLQREATLRHKQRRSPSVSNEDHLLWESVAGRRVSGANLQCLLDSPTVFPSQLSWGVLTMAAPSDVGSCVLSVLVRDVMEAGGDDDSAFTDEEDADELPQSTAELTDMAARNSWDDAAAAECAAGMLRRISAAVPCSRASRRRRKVNALAQRLRTAASAGPGATGRELVAIANWAKARGGAVLAAAAGAEVEIPRPKVPPSPARPPSTRREPQRQSAGSLLICSLTTVPPAVRTEAMEVRRLAAAVAKMPPAPPTHFGHNSSVPAVGDDDVDALLAGSLSARAPLSGGRSSLFLQALSRHPLSVQLHVMHVEAVLRTPVPQSVADASAAAAAAALGPAQDGLNAFVAAAVAASRRAESLCFERASSGAFIMQLLCLWLRRKAFGPADAAASVLQILRSRRAAGCFSDRHLAALPLLLAALATDIFPDSIARLWAICDGMPLAVAWMACPELDERRRLLALAGFNLLRERPWSAGVVADSLLMAEAGLLAGPCGDAAAAQHRIAAALQARPHSLALWRAAAEVAESGRSGVAAADMVYSLVPADGGGWGWRLRSAIFRACLALRRGDHAAALRHTTPFFQRPAEEADPTDDAPHAALACAHSSLRRDGPAQRRRLMESLARAAVGCQGDVHQCSSAHHEMLGWAGGVGSALRAVKLVQSSGERCGPAAGWQVLTAIDGACTVAAANGDADTGESAGGQILTECHSRAATTARVLTLLSSCGKRLSQTLRNAMCKGAGLWMVDADAHFEAVQDCVLPSGGGEGQDSE